MIELYLAYCCRFNNGLFSFYYIINNGFYLYERILLLNHQNRKKICCKFECRKCWKIFRDFNFSNFPAARDSPHMHVKLVVEIEEIFPWDKVVFTPMQIQTLSPNLVRNRRKKLSNEFQFKIKSTRKLRNSLQNVLDYQTTLQIFSRSPVASKDYPTRRTQNSPFSPNFNFKRNEKISNPRKNNNRQWPGYPVLHKRILKSSSFDLGNPRGEAVNRFFFDLPLESILRRDAGTKNPGEGTRTEDPRFFFPSNDRWISSSWEQQRVTTAKKNGGKKILRVSTVLELSWDSILLGDWWMGGEWFPLAESGQLRPCVEFHFCPSLSLFVSFGFPLSSTTLRGHPRRNQWLLALKSGLRTRFTPPSSCRHLQTESEGERRPTKDAPFGTQFMWSCYTRNEETVFAGKIVDSRGGLSFPISQFFKFLLHFFLLQTLNMSNINSSNVSESVARWRYHSSSSYLLPRFCLHLQFTISSLEVIFL